MGTIHDDLVYHNSAIITGMEASPTAPTSLSCSQCGGALHPDEGQIFLTCPYCGATVYLDKRQVVFHWYLASTLDEARARGVLARWMSGSQTVKDLDRKARLEGITFEYFPLWVFKRRTANKQETILLEPAAATSISEMRRLQLPAGDLRKYKDELNSQAHPPTVPVETALGWLAERQIPAQEIAERSLVHIPLFTCKYQYAGHTFTAVIEGATGGVFANIYPAKDEAPFAMVGGLTALVYLVLALLPVGGAMIDESAAAIGLALCSGLGLLAAPLLLALAFWVASKV
jgi:predicted RNA-binding Zn-ribbon protein involved in translation (DUF1610 family)